MAVEDTQTASGQDDRGRAATATAATVRILVAYATRHGSTAEVAEAVGAELRSADVDVTVKQISGGLRADAYDAVVVGGPMIMGWHKDAGRFLKRNSAALAGRPTACFATAASLTETQDESVAGVPLFRDPWLVKVPRRADHLTYKERYASPRHYFNDIVGPARAVRFVGVAFFGGSVDLTKMNLLEKLFVMLIVGAAPGDLRNWEAIRAWGREILPRLLGN
jgi:menaquinone-dependent protoporphyrinogen oxidase